MTFRTNQKFKFMNKVKIPKITFTSVYLTKASNILYLLGKCYSVQNSADSD